MRPSDVAAIITNAYPLVDERMTRADCQRWLAGRGWQAPKSACLGGRFRCRFRADRRWRELRDACPAEWADAVAFDRAIRAGHRRHGQPALRGRADLHRCRVPLDRVDLRPLRGRERTAESGEGFRSACHGVCGA